MRNEIALTDEQIEERFSDHSIIIDDLIFTRETIEHFFQASNNYLEFRTRKMVAPDQLEICGAQIWRGQTRFDITIIDFGSVRAVLT